MGHVLMAVSGPSGVGKGTLVKTIIKRRDDVVESISCTTRAPREGEVDGREYFFISKEEFLRRIDENGFWNTTRILKIITARRLRSSTRR